MTYITHIHNMASHGITYHDVAWHHTHSYHGIIGHHITYLKSHNIPNSVHVGGHRAGMLLHHTVLPTNKGRVTYLFSLDSLTILQVFLGHIIKLSFAKHIDYS